QQRRNVTQLVGGFVFVGRIDKAAEVIRGIGAFVVDARGSSIVGARRRGRQQRNHADEQRARRDSGAGGVHARQTPEGGNRAYQIAPAARTGLWSNARGR